MNIVAEFEALLESYYPNTKAIAVNSGTSALLACLKSLDLKEKDEVITTPFTFQATTDAIVLAGGTPVFADISIPTHLITPNTVKPVLSGNSKCIVPVNLFGRVVLDGVINLNKLPTIEDSAQAFLHPKNLVTRSDAQCFSFYRTKNLQASEGGAIIVKKNGMLDYEKIWSICNNGRLPDKPKYEHYYVGYNFRMSEHTALILYNQLKYHPKSIKAELGIYGEKNGYYKTLTYQQPSYTGRFTPNCPNAEKVVKKIKEQA